MKIVDLINKKFGKLLVIRQTGSSRSGSKLWECQCDCGKITYVTTKHLNRKNNTVKSCGCLSKLKGKNHKDWKGFGDISGDWWASRITRAQKRRSPIEVTINIEYAWNLFLNQNGKCSLTGEDIKISNESNIGTASLDRIDSSKGYIEGNVQWVHKHINFMKNKFSEDYFIEMCKKVSKYR